MNSHQKPVSAEGKAKTSPAVAVERPSPNSGILQQRLLDAKAERLMKNLFWDGQRSLTLKLDSLEWG